MKTATLSAMVATAMSAALFLTLAVALAPPSAAATRSVPLTQVSADPYTTAGAEHATEAEPDVYGWGNTLVSAFQVGRYSDGGSDNTGWATSVDGGHSWRHGFLPGATTVAGGKWSRISDPVVAYDAKHGTWLISGLAIDANVNGIGVSVNSSTDGLTWHDPVLATGVRGESYDKEWITCDNTVTSPHFGNCYVEVDETSANDQVVMVTSADGGKTWSPERTPKNQPHGLGGQPLVQPNGTVVVPYLSDSNDIRAFTSTDGGSSWNADVRVAATNSHNVTGMRADPLPSAQIDGSGRVYVAWEDCRFRSGCSANDIVLSTSTDGQTWSPVTRVPIDPTTSGADHFDPGIGVDHATSGGSAKLGLYYYFYPNASCAATACQLEEGFVSSANGGSTWSAPKTLTAPMSLSWLAQAQGAMVGDYQGCAVLGGNATGVFAVGAAASGSTLNQAMDTAGPLPVAGGSLRGATAFSNIQPNPAIAARTVPGVPQTLS
jgi:hypothetical protein